MPHSIRERMLEEVAVPVHPRRGTPYLCLQEDLDIVRQRPGFNHRLFVSQRQATMEVVGCNDLRRSLSSYEREAIRRLSHAVYDATRNMWGPDLVMKMFLDLDAFFFGGVLRGYVCLFWKAKNIFSDEGGSHGITRSCSRPGHAVIYLNAEAILLGPSPFKDMLRTVLHEMCHACEIVRVGVSDGHSHSLEFGTKIHAVDSRARCFLGLRAVAKGEYWPFYDTTNPALHQGR